MGLPVLLCLHPRLAKDFLLEPGQLLQLSWEDREIAGEAREWEFGVSEWGFGVWVLEFRVCKGGSQFSVRGSGCRCEGLRFSMV